MPMDMCIRSLAPDTQDVDALGSEQRSKTLAYRKYQSLEFQILAFSKITGDLLSVSLGCDQYVTLHGGKSIEECDRAFRLSHDMMRIAWIASQKLADEAGRPVVEP